MISTAWTDPACEAIAQLLSTRTGLTFPPNRTGHIEAAVRRAVARSSAGCTAEYLRLMETGAIALDDLIADATVGETYFFRDPALFEHIRERVLPEITARIGTSRPVRLWSAGCASGEEAYSLAILIEERRPAIRAHILATDISRTALAKAQAAAYGQWSLRACDPAFVERYFERARDRWTLRTHIRERVTFEYLNLAVDSYPSMATNTWGMDLILCRNVMIYLDRRTIETVAARLLECLADGGLLVTGPSDPWLSEIVPCETVTTPAGTFYRRRHGTQLQERPVPGSDAAQSPTPAPALAPSLPPVAAEAHPASPLQPPAPITVADMFERRRDAFDRGHYDRALELTHAGDPEPGAAEIRVRALADMGRTAQAASEVEEALSLRPLAAELHFLRGVLRLSLGDDSEAARSLRNAIYIDRSLAVAHFALGAVLRRLGDPAGARRSYRNALDLCSALPAQAPVPLSDGECAGRVAEACRVQIDLLEAGS
ncbi:MAG: CheR family methyltransferase [Acidobacteriota bacterium]